MFRTVPKEIDTSKWENSFYGKGTTVKVEHTTAFRSREAILIRELLNRRRYEEDYVEPFNTIGETNIVVKRNKLIIGEKALFGGNRTEFKGNDLYCSFFLHQAMNPKLFGYKKYGTGIYMRPILITKSDRILAASDIIGVAGLQLLSRDNVGHNQLKPIFVRGIKRV